MTYHQVDAGFETSTPAIIVRTTGDPADLTQTLRSLVREQDPSLAVQSVMTMDARIGTSLARPRLYSVLLGAFAGFALLVSGIGIFGVLSYSVAQRTREIGVRSALGASSRNITALVVRQGLGVTVWGIVIGLGAAFVLARQAGSLLYGVTAERSVELRGRADRADRGGRDRVLRAGASRGACRSAVSAQGTVAPGARTGSRRGRRPNTPPPTASDTSGRYRSASAANPISIVKSTADTSEHPSRQRQRRRTPARESPSGRELHRADDAAREDDRDGGLVAPAEG